MTERASTVRLQTNPRDTWKARRRQITSKLRELEVKLETNANSQEKINILLVNKVGELEKK